MAGFHLFYVAGIKGISKKIPINPIFKFNSSRFRCAEFLLSSSLSAVFLK